MKTHTRKSGSKQNDEAVSQTHFDEIAPITWEVVNEFEKLIFKSIDLDFKA